MNKWYGSIENRLEENKMYCDEIKVGTGVTEYSYTDRTPYEVIEVINNKDVIVRELDHQKADDIPMSNNWKLISNLNNCSRELVYRYNSWYWKMKSLTGKVIYSKANVSFGVADYYFDYEF